LQCAVRETWAVNLLILLTLKTDGCHGYGMGAIKGTTRHSGFLMNSLV
jgi:hypothetical protein